jgi:hypothetical protein
VARPIVYAVDMDCGLNCRIFLHFQSPAGKYGGTKYLPNGTWPATFVCLQHGPVSLRSAAEVHPAPPTWDPKGKAPTFWEIEARCAYENCGKQHTIYAAHQPNVDVLIGALVRSRPSICCGEHEPIWRADRIQAHSYYDLILRIRIP